MISSAIDDRLAKERRRRLAAERLLAQKSDELFSANRQLAVHADQLSSTVIEQRVENQELRGAQQRVLVDLDLATEQAGRAERRLWDSLEALGDGFAMYDRNWCLVAANKHYMALFDGLADVGLGAPYDLVLQAAVNEGLFDIGETDPDDWLDEMLVRWEMDEIEDLTLRLFDGSHIRLQDKRASDGGIVSMVMDISETMLREEALRDARDAAETANRAKSAFLAKMSHEIRTPMNGVVGMADLLLESALDDENRLYAETIRSSGESLLGIINDILDFSKLEAEKMEFRPAPMDLEQLLLELVRLSEASLADKPVELVLDYPMDVRSGFICDREKMRQLLTNLIGNAIKFTSDGFVRVSVSINGVDAEGQRLVSVSVEDTGIGIPEDMQEHIFEEFNQVEDEKNRRFEGTGLGLAITKALVQRMGGTLTLHSVVDVGSTFTVQMAMAVDPAQTAAALPRLAISRAAIKGLAPTTTAILAQHLDALGLEVIMSEDLEAAQVVFVATEIPVAEQIDILADAPAHSPVISIGPVSKAGDALRQRAKLHLPLPFQRAALTSMLAEITPPALPTAPPTPEPAPAPKSEAPVVLRMLAAEDNKTNQFVFKKMLKDLTLDLTLVDNGRKAVDAFLDLRPHVIFTDISMPEMDGLEASRAIRALEAKHGLEPVPIVAMTAHAMKDDEAEIKKTGLTHYLTKPLKKAALHETLRSVLPAGIDPFPAPESD